MLEQQPYTQMTRLFWLEFAPCFGFFPSRLQVATIIEKIQHLDDIHSIILDLFARAKITMENFTKKKNTLQVQARKKDWVKTFFSR